MYPRFCFLIVRTFYTFLALDVRALFSSVISWFHSAVFPIYKYELSCFDFAYLCSEIHDQLDNVP